MAASRITTNNLLICALSESDRALLDPHLERTQLKFKDRLFEMNEPIERVYFLENGVASIVAEQEPGEFVEIGMHGYDGMSGAPVILGAGQSPHVSMVQVGNPSALSIDADRLLEACRTSSSLQELLMKYAQSLNVQAALTAASNAFYALPERLARWLLMCHDRSEGDRMELTHEFLAMMLGVRRSGVTVTLHTLESTGAIRATRGVVTIVDRAKLEEIAGTAYGQAEAEYRRLIGPFGRGSY